MCLTPHITIVRALSRFSDAPPLMNYYTMRTLLASVISLGGAALQLIAVKLGSISQKLLSGKDGRIVLSLSHANTKTYASYVWVY